MAITHTDTSERGLQGFIVKQLCEKQGYYETKSGDFDKDFCINREEFLAFLAATQEENYHFIQQKGERAFFVRLDKKIKQTGIIETLRKGIKHFDKKITLFYPQPNSSLNPLDQTHYEANRFSVTQELIYSPSHSNRIDLVLSLNGLPLVTLELKNGFTRQAVVNAIRQYKTDRSAKDKIFNFARCMVHFAVDTDLAFMTTRINANKTFFMPFNKGLNDGSPHEPFGAGNPVNPEGIKTAYLWEQVFSKSSLSNIIEKFAQVIAEKDSDTHKISKTLFFPRYHQLMAVRQLLADTKEHGVGKRYLIQHSAGSGKSNSITWLAHQLTGLYDKTNTHALFDSVVVVTDRTVLDRQIRDNIKRYSHVKDVVEAITGQASAIKSFDREETSLSKTTHMRLALENNKRIIICTVQTFPWVMKAVDSMANKRIAFIIDEAHSSQSGKAAASMNALFSDSEFKELERDEDGNISTEELLNYLMESRKMLKNASYYAFTATPKEKTLETFGVKQEDGKFKPFHTYSMKQAIEEKYILDVLKNYTTYDSYFKIRSKDVAEEEKEYEKNRANKKLKKLVESDIVAISQKARIMINHFNKHVRKRIQSKARAMVVCNSIESAMKYKDCFDDILAELNLPYKAIVAFSGNPEHYKTQKKVTENDINAFADHNHNIPQQFKKEPYRFLIVANKYQTGFDEPLLHTMYVDKLLSSVQAVQTLSRLNRAKKPHKKDTFVLDFVNSLDDIEKAFSPYYTTTILSGETDVNKLNDLEDGLEEAQVYRHEDVEQFFKLYYGNAERDATDPLIDNAVYNFEHDLEQKEQIVFKSNAKSFVRTFGYLAKLLESYDAYWEQLYLFLDLLIPKLNIEDDEPDEDILKVVDMDSYHVERVGMHDIELEEDNNAVEPIPVGMSQIVGNDGAEYDSLKNIIDEFNDRFGNIDWGVGVDPEEAIKILATQIPVKIKSDEETLRSIRNSDKDNAKVTSDKKVYEMIQQMMFAHTSIYKKFMDDPDFKDRYETFIFDDVWDKAHKELEDEREV